MFSTRYQRPGLALRVGVIGMPELGSAMVRRIEQQVHDVLTLIQAEVLASAELAAIKSAYKTSGTGPTFWFLSSLSAGADQLAARCAYDLGFQLYVPMPFARDEYEADFQTDFDLQQFKSLLEKAGDAWFALDGARGEFEHRSYEAAGHMVSRHCDILIAVWDGKTGERQDRMHETLMFALATGTPLVWINTETEAPPRWIADTFDLAYPKQDEPDATERIKSHLQTLITPPAHIRRPHHEWIDKLAHLFHQHLYLPHEDHFSESGRRVTWIWRAYSVFIRWAAGKDAQFSATHPPDSDPALYWFNRYFLPDARSSEYAARYRSVFIWVFLLGVLSLIAGTTSLVAGTLALVLTSTTPIDNGAISVSVSVAGGFAAAELVFLVVIFGFVFHARRHHWHERSIEYRLLAELCRKQQALAPIGWTLPVTAVRTLIEDEIDDRGQIARDRATWVAWLFFAEVRAAPLPRGKLMQEAKSAYQQTVMSDLIARQLAYHVSRREICETAERWLEKLGFIFFGLVIGSVVFKLVMAEWFGMLTVALPFGWLAVVLPGLSAAFVGIRAYTELQLLAAQSKHMTAALQLSGNRIARITAETPLASQDLGAETAGIATLMVQDLEGWARLFRIKGAEVG